MSYILQLTLVISASLAGFKDTCQFSAELCRGQLGVMFMLATRQSATSADVKCWSMAVQWFHVADEAHV